MKRIPVEPEVVRVNTVEPDMMLLLRLEDLDQEPGHEGNWCAQIK